MTQSAAQALIEKMSKQHHALEQIWSALRAALKGDRVNQQALLGQLQQLSIQLEEHFRFEEEDGYFDEAVAKAPRLQRQADHLRGQHTEMLGAIARLQASASRLAAEPAQLTAMRGLLEEVSKTFVEHETAEGRLLEDAYCSDTTALD